MQFSTGARILLGILCVFVVAEGLYINYVMGGKVTSVIAKGTSCERVVEKWQSEHKAENTNRRLFTGKAAIVDYKGTPLKQAENFKTAIDKAVADGPNFAGKYAVAQWGCGTQCQGHAIVDVQTGKVITFGPETQAGISVTPDSNILITNPKENFPPPAEMQKANLSTLISLANLPREYYVMDKEGTDEAALRKICTENPFEGVGL